MSWNFLDGLSSFGDSIFGGIRSGLSSIGEGISSIKEDVGGALFGPSEKSYLEENPMPEPPGEDATMDERDAYDVEYEEWLKGKEEAAARDASLKKVAEYAPGPGGAGQAQKGTSSGTGPGPISMATRQPSYGAIKSPYEMVERGLGTSDLTKLVLNSLQARARSRITSMSAPRIRGLLG